MPVVKVLLSAALALVALSTQAACGDSGTYLTVGPEAALTILGSTEKREGFYVALGRARPNQRLSSSWLDGQLLYEAAFDVNRSSFNKSIHPSDRAGFTFDAVARTSPRRWRGFRPFAEVGFGLYFTNVSRDLNVEINSSPSVGFGVGFGRDGRDVILDVRLRHASNGGIHAPNRGQNMIQFSLSFRFG